MLAKHDGPIAMTRSTTGFKWGVTAVTAIHCACTIATIDPSEAGPTSGFPLLSSSAAVTNTRLHDDRAVLPNFQPFWVGSETAQGASPCQRPERGSFPRSVYYVIKLLYESRVTRENTP